MKKIISSVMLNFHADGSITAHTTKATDWTTLAFGDGDDLNEFINSLSPNEDMFTEESGMAPLFTVGNDNNN